MNKQKFGAVLSLGQTHDEYIVVSLGLQRGRRRWGRGGSCPPTFESWGAQPLQFFTSLCAVVIVWLYGDYSPMSVNDERRKHFGNY